MTIKKAPITTEPLGFPGTARQLAAGAASANTALTTGVFRISIRASTADIRFEIGSGSQTALMGMATLRSLSYQLL